MLTNVRGTLTTVTSMQTVPTLKGASTAPAILAMKEMESIAQVHVHCDLLIYCVSVMFSSPLDINECERETHNCDHNALCTDTLGSFMCTCNSGYEGNGVACTSELASDSTHRYYTVSTASTFAPYRY